MNRITNFLRETNIKQLRKRVLYRYVITDNAVCPHIKGKQKQVLGGITEQTED